MEKWFIRNKGIDFTKIAKDLRISEIIAKILVNRDIYDYEQIERFLNPTLDKLYAPNLMFDLVKGAEIIRRP